jgi:glycine betaine/proline transport system substrate-binding protein
MRPGLGGAIAVIAAALAAPASAQCGRVSLAEMSWGSAAILAHIEEIILNKGYGCRTELLPGDTVPTTTSMAGRGEPDVAPELWINAARETIERAVQENRIKIAAKIFPDGGEEGWYIPTYMLEKHPELTSLEAVLKRPDLFPDSESRGKGRFYTCPAGWACQIVNDNLFRAYALDKAGFVKFDPGSGEGLAAAIARAHQRKEPIFTYYFGPTAVLGRYPMHRLTGMTHEPTSWGCMSKPDCPDPKPNMYPPADVIGAVTAKFAARAPDAFAFLQKVQFKNETVSALLAWQDERRARPEEAAKHFLATQPDVWDKWVSAEIAEKVKKAVK